MQSCGHRPSEEITLSMPWHLGDCPFLRNQKAMAVKWVFKSKRNSDGSVADYKARVVGKGSHSALEWIH